MKTGHRLAKAVWADAWTGAWAVRVGQGRHMRCISILYRSFGVCVLGLACALALGCDGSTEPGHANSATGRATGRAVGHKPVVITSIPPLASLLEPLVGDWGKVESLLHAGVSVHGQDTSSNQMHMAAGADMLVVVGRNLDGWAQQLTQQAAGKRNVPVVTFAKLFDGSSGVNQTTHVHHDDDHAHDHHADHDADALNPHLWLDPVLARKFVAWIAPQIQALATNEADRLASQKAAAALDAKLASLDQQYRDALGKLQRKDMVTFHNAFDLLAKRYGLHVAAHLTDVELAPGGEVTATQLIDTIKTIRKLNLKVVYAEPQFPSRATQVLTQETGVSILRLDPLGGKGLPDYDTYFNMMNSNLKVIVEGQSIP